MNITPGSEPFRSFPISKKPYEMQDGPRKSVFLTVVPAKTDIFVQFISM